MLISVVCPVYDTDPALLRPAILSAIDQPHVAEVIVVDDCSQRPATLAALEEWGHDPRVRVIRQRSNRGPASARNSGIEAATGEWIGFLDADDVWAEGRTALLPALASPDVQWLGGQHAMFEEGSGAWRPCVPLHDRLGAESGQPAAVLGGAALTRLFLSDFCMHLGAMLTRRSLLLQAGGFTAGLSYAEDFLLMSKLSVLAPLHYVPAVTYGWRQGHASLTSSPARLRARSMAMYRAAAADPVLRDFRREVRWARYGAWKGLALNNLVAGRRARALAFATRALAIDPREMGDMKAFLGLWWAGPGAARRDGRRYSGAEVFDVRETS